MTTPPETAAALYNGRTPTLATREPDEPPARRTGKGMSSFWPILVAIVVGGLLLWAFAGVLSVAFRIAEYVALAVVAGWVGYKLGHSRGRRGH